MKSSVEDRPERDAPAAAPSGPPQGAVLSTLNEDGSRNWLRPRLSRGRFLHARRAVAYGLIALFALLPYIRVAGKPAILLDIGNREFTVLGKTFLPTDSIVLALFMVGAFITIFWITALLGRAWCGWACPHTVYMEFVFRPLERLFEGAPRRGGAAGRRKSAVTTALKYVSFLLVSIFVAHVFLAYFVGVEALASWVRLSPLEHPVPFLVMAATTAAMMFHFSYFREQLCIVACPYGRLQSVMLDRNSLTVAYDYRRGETRGKLRKRQEDPSIGDCVDCNLCVETCPTGIDIRDGLRMECVQCTQCIDACDAVMDKIGKPRGLIRYGTQATMAGESSRWLRPRVLVYPALLLVIGVALVFAVDSKTDADVRLMRGMGAPYTVMTDGRVSNALRLKITNRRSVARLYTVEVVDDPAVTLMLAENPIAVEVGEAKVTSGNVLLEPDLFASGRREITLRVTDGEDFTKDILFRAIGPAGRKEIP